MRGCVKVGVVIEFFKKKKKKELAERISLTRWFWVCLIGPHCCYIPSFGFHSALELYSFHVATFV